MTFNPTQNPDLTHTILKVLMLSGDLHWVNQVTSLNAFEASLVSVSIKGEAFSSAFN